ncbi:hypothetical protein F5876DRAFT_73528 [Lentinula aff. lateritia]|uniref:Uncharacterized protein n=1 Tax=Lentinula aff. lateritia TaxID=2804960 RepID=A0ACC1UAN7_9AGAR|nr:hypothetical protein F5876DRAFT_73528 [Lentinula aff. lateritia]
MSLSSDFFRLTLGSAFAGCMVAVGLSAVLGFQVFLYFRIFPSDALQYKVLVGWIWVLDVVHTVLLCTTMWQYLIVNFGNVVALGEIFPTAAVDISMTAITTLTVNGWRIYKMSEHNWWLIGPIASLSVSQAGLSFTVYSNSVLATLNLRNWYRHRYADPVGLSLMRPLSSDGQTVHHVGHSPLPNHSSSPSKHAYPDKINGTAVEVYMQRQVEYDISNVITNDAQANAEN